MIEKNEQEELLKIIDKLLAGEKPGLDDDSSDDLKRLAALAEELHSQRPLPDEGFEAELLEKITSSEHVETQPGATDKKVKHRLLPGWLTKPRMAAATAALIIALSAAGLTSAIIRSGGNGVFDGNGVVAEKNASLENRDQGAVSANEDVAEQFAPEADGGLSSAAGSAADVPTVRRVLQSASYEIEVPSGEFESAYEQINVIAAELDGYVVSAQSTASTGEGEINHGSITIRVADTGDNFTRAQSRLDDLGNVISRDISGQDVTEEYVDLQSRLRNAQSQEASLLALIDKAQTIDEILSVQSYLDSVRQEIEQLQGRIKYMESRTDYATFTIELYEEDSVESGDDGDLSEWGFTNALKYAGWLAVQTVNFVIVALGVIIPAVVILTLLGAPAYLLLKRRSRD